MKRRAIRLLPRAPHPSVAGPRGSVKRAVDAALAALALVVLSPLLALLALLVAATSRGSVIYRQRRLGLYGRPFTMLKFRTMVADAEPDGRAVWASRDDPRCTAVGRLLRRSSLDELPQLVNILRGEMSFVGPRPERPEFAREFAGRWDRFDDRLAVRGGLTGLAQVEGWHGDSDVGERLACDLRYVERWSLGADAAILLRTIPEVLLPRRTRANRVDGAGRAHEKPAAPQPGERPVALTPRPGTDPLPARARR